MSTINKEEIQKFSLMAEEWWDVNGKFKPLHMFNPVRIEYILVIVCSHFILDRKKNFPLKKQKILDFVSGVSVCPLGHNNKKIVLGAADTFRAAAVNQLSAWAKKINADIIKSDEGADPASVAYKALEYAKKNNFDYLLIDTAGRLQNKKNLMDEFKKITKVVKKIDSDAPHETFLILDATTGQSAINQVEEFQKITPVTGIIMTKLDSTAKGGILLAIGKKFKLPIVALGMGEKEDDLQIFNAQHYSNALMIN